MNNSYHEIMDQIEVTDEMRSRILSNLSKEMADMDDKPSKVVRFSKWQKYASIAACLAVLIVCGAVVQNLAHKDPDVPQEEFAGPVADIVECASAEELSKKAGFTVEELKELPFDVSEVSYTWQWNELAQIDYTGENNALMYRKALGDEDISGVYTEYANVQTQDINGDTVAIKGTDGLCYLATWQSDGYTHALYADNGVSYDDMNEMIALLIP